LQESRGPAQGFRTFKLCAPELLFENLFGLATLAVAGEGLTEGGADERIINAFGAQFLLNSLGPVPAAIGAGTGPVPGESLVAGIARCAELFQSQDCQSG
jgi:hypothetical protein